MVKINYDLDLRSAEYISSTRFFKSGALKLVLTLCLFLLPLALFYGLEGYKAHLEQNTSALEAELSVLSLRAEPFIAMTAESEQIRARLELENKLDNVWVSWSSTLHKIRTAAPQTLNLDSIVIDSGGRVEIKGASSEMQSPALYRQNLDNLAFTGNTELKSVAMNSQGGYSFTVTTIFISQKEVTGDEN